MELYWKVTGIELKCGILNGPILTNRDDLSCKSKIQEIT